MFLRKDTWKKDKKEWVVKENNHESIISKEQFIRVGKILDGNYRGNLHIQRENKHDHIFSKKLYCGKCGKMLFAALDSHIIEKQKNRSKQRLYYKNFEDTILQYLKEHGSAKRIDLQNLTNLNWDATTELLKELI
ncbi:recombinase family protein [Oceanobacillus sp. FSL K6-3682]|uniref:recombinase family protein n=1 Tax=Oceanobacillus sp. FSL K6-3682 TaxID=2921503 RepID=UPI0030DD014D